MADGKLKSNTDEMWSFFSDLNRSVDHLNNECDTNQKKLQYMEQRLQEKLREIKTKIDNINEKIAALKSQNNDNNIDDVLARIEALQFQINQLEEKKLRIKKYLDIIPEHIESLKRSQNEYQYVFRAAKRIINKYLKMVEITIAQRELTDYQKTTVAGQYHAMNYRGTTFYCNDDVFDIDAVDSEGRTNLQRMELGIAPLGKDGKAIELHHIAQSGKLGGIVELSSSMHRKNHKALHINTNDIPSGINRPNFDTLRNAYWKRRAEFIKRGENING